MLKAHCAWCLRRGDKKCGQCGSVHYCSEECAYRDKRNHAPHCERARAEGREAIISAMKHELKCKMVDADALDIFLMAVKLGRVKLVTHMLNRGNIVFANDMVRLFTNFMGPLRTSSYAHSYMVHLTFDFLSKTCPDYDYGYWLKVLIINAYENGINDTLKLIYNELLFVTAAPYRRDCKKNQEKRKLTVIDAFMDKDLESTDMANTLVLAFIEAGADVNVNIDNASANNVLHFYCIVEDFDENIVRTLIRAGINVNHKNCIGLTPLLNAFYRIKDEDMSASEDSLLRCVSIFMEMAPSSIDYAEAQFCSGLEKTTTQNIYGVLGVAVYRKCTKIVKMLIDGGFIQHLNVVLNHAIHYPSNKKECASILLSCMDDSLLSSKIEEFRKSNLHPKTLNALHSEKARRRENIKKKQKEEDTVVCDEIREQALMELLSENTSNRTGRRSGRRAAADPRR